MKFLSVICCVLCIDSYMTGYMNMQRMDTFQICAASISYLDREFKSCWQDQKVQNMAARLILRVDRWSSATASRKTLHWLPIKQRIVFKIVVLVYKCLCGLAPKYVSDMSRVHIPVRTTRRSVDPLLLEVPVAKRSTFADRSFSVYGPQKWNELPLSLRQSTSVDSFKSGLKSHLFVRAYNWW